MRPMLYAPVAALFVTAMWGGAAAAAPLFAAPAIGAAPDAGIIQVGGCHNRTHNHYVPEWGVSVPHHHVGRHCRPVRDENDSGGYYDDDAPGFYFEFGDHDHDRHHRRHRHRHDSY